LYRYTVARPEDVSEGAEEAAFRYSMKDIAVESLNLLVEVGLCRLNQFDPCPITYSLQTHNL
jgi:hypothetical protein